MRRPLLRRLRPLVLASVLTAIWGAAPVFPQHGSDEGELTVDATALGRLARGISVRLEGAISGSGVLVGRRGRVYTVLTAWHVVRDHRPGEEIAVITADGVSRSVEASRIRRFPGHDLAMLEFSSERSYRVASPGRFRDLELGTPLVVAGFPRLERGEGRQPLRLKFGRLEALLATPRDDGYQLLYSNATLPGMSGGPVLNRQGELVGIHGRAELHVEASGHLGKPIASSTNMGLTLDPYLQIHTGGGRIGEVDRQPGQPGQDRGRVRSASTPEAQLQPQLLQPQLERLDEALSHGRLSEADALTRTLLLAEPGQGEWLSAASVDRLSCRLLLAVDASWRHHSRDRHGFSSQRSLWPGDFSGFAALAGWRRGGFVQDIESTGGDLPKGYYPRRVADGPILQGLLARFGRCQAEGPQESR